MGMSALRFMFRDSAPVEEARAQVKERASLVEEEKNAVREEQAEEELAEAGAADGAAAAGGAGGAKSKALIGEWPPELVFFMRSNELLRGLAIELGVRHPTLKTMSRLARCALRLEALKSAAAATAAATAAAPLSLSPSPTSRLHDGVRRLLGRLRQQRRVLGVQLCIEHPSCGVVDIVAGELGELDPRPVAPDSLFCLFGLSAVVCVGALHAECAARDINLDAPIREHWPALALDDGGATPTIRALLEGAFDGVEARLPASMSFKTLLRPESLAQSIASGADAPGDLREGGAAQAAASAAADPDAPAPLAGWWAYGWGAALSGLARALSGASLAELVRRHTPGAVLKASGDEALRMASFSLIAPQYVGETRRASAGTGGAEEMWELRGGEGASDAAAAEEEEAEAEDEEEEEEEEDDGWSAAALSLAGIIAQAVEQGVSPLISSQGKEFLLDPRLMNNDSIRRSSLPCSNVHTSARALTLAMHEPHMQAALSMLATSGSFYDGVGRKVAFMSSNSVVRTTEARTTIGGTTILHDASSGLTITLLSNCLATHPDAARDIVELICEELDLGAPLDLFA
jgi:CubicO group peptidase (beta-lactamase class C family)